MFDTFLRFCHRFERRVSASVLAVVAGLLVLAGVAGATGTKAGSEVAHSPKITTSSTSTSTTATTVATRSPIEGFRTASFAITPSGGAPESHCAMLADTNDSRARGLMNEAGLRGYDAMVFVFPEDVRSSFYMANVKFPLSVAWFDGNGHYVSSADMEICGVAAEACPRYGATGPYRFAIETAKGGLGALHIGDGSTLAVGAGGSCT